MNIEQLSNSRAVGSFDLLSPPLTPIGLIDAQKLLQAVKESVRTGSRHIVVDCSGLSFLYSDTLNVLGQMGKTLKNHGGSLGILSSNPSIIKAISAPALQDILNHFSEEHEMLQASVHLMSAASAEVKAPPPKSDAERADTPHPVDAVPQEEEEKVSESPEIDHEVDLPDEFMPEEYVPAEPPTRQMPLSDEGIGASFLKEDQTDETAQLPRVEELLVENGDEVSKELGGELPFIEEKKKVRRWPIVLIVVALLGALAAAAHFFGLF